MKLLYPLDFCQLVRSQQVIAKLRLRVCWEPVGLHQVGDEADFCLWEGVQAVVKPGLLNGDGVKPESTIRTVNQALGLVVHKGGSLTTLFARASSGRGISRCSMLLCVLSRCYDM